MTAGSAITDRDQGTVWPNAAWWFMAALLPLAIFVGVHWSWSPPAWAGDYAQYLSHARALAEGRAYADIGYIYNPEAWTIGPPAYPPGLPLTLAPLVALAGVDSVVFRLFTLACLIAFLWFAHRRLSRDIGPYQAAIGAGLAALSIELQLGTIAPLSDLPFAALLWALVLVADHDEQWSQGRVAAVTALGFALFSYRVAGVAVVPALGLYALLRWRKDRGRSLLPVIAWGGAGLLAIALGIVRNPYADGVDAVSMTLSTQLAIVRSNYRLMLFEAELYPFGINRLDDVYHVIASVFVVIGGVILLWRIRRSFLLLLLFAYTAMLALAPVADLRYSWPLFPVVGASLVVGVHAVLKRLLRSARTAQMVTVALGVVIVVGAIRNGLSAPRPFSIVGTRDAEEAYAWLSQRQREAPSRLMFHNPRVVTLETRMPAMGLTPRNAPGQLVAIDERRISYVMTQPDSVSECLQRIVNRLPASYPDRFTLAYENPTFRIYQVLPAAEPFRGEYAQIRWRRDEQWCPR